MLSALQKYELVSFDVFDTVITRITAHPKAVFLLIQEDLQKFEDPLPRSLLDNFCTIRIEAERSARKSSDAEDVLIGEIYEVIQKKHNLAREIVERLVSLEVQVESRAIKVIPETFQLIKALRGAGVRIAFISDMYLPVDVLEKILQGKGVFEDGDRIYVSGHMGLAKRTGNLFREVLHLEQLQPSQWHHFGDNRRSDYTQAKKNGITSMHLERGCLNHYEKILALPRMEDTTWLQWQLIAGASRIARLQCIDDDKRHRSLHAIGANIAGPILFAFVYWVLHDLAQKGARRVYFLARDGQVLHEIAQRIAPLIDADIELRYLYASRQAWHLPSVINISERDLDWITKKDPHLTLRRIALRLEIDANELAEFLRLGGFNICDVDKPLPDDEIEAFRRALYNDRQLQKRVLGKASDLRETLVKYLRQEGVFEDPNAYIVDSGWRGSLQDSLEKVAAAIDANVSVAGYYFGLLGDVPPSERKHAYLFSASHPKECLEWGKSFCHLFELFTLADHGLTVRYACDGNNKVEPALGTHLSPCVVDGRLNSMRDGIFSFVDSLMEARNVYPHLLCGIDFRTKILELIKRFYVVPSAGESEALGGWEYAADQFEVDTKPFAPVITLRDVLRFIREIGGRERLAITYWIHGSRMRSGISVRYLVYVLALSYRIKNSLLGRLAAK